MHRIRSRQAAGVAGIALAFFLVSSLAGAQTVVNPTAGEFVPSTDHSALAADGTPLVTSYTLSVFVAGQTTPVRTISLGKPTPDPDGLIRFNLTTLLTTPLAPNVVYEGHVSAVGPGGTGESLPSNTFTFQTGCSPTISPASQPAPAAGGTGTVAVTADAACSWNAAANDAFITIGAGASGTGNGSVTYSVAANAGTATRTGTMTIAGQTFTVTQAGTSCTFAISPATQSVVAAGGSGSVSVTTPAGCTWAASSNAAWLTISAGTSGSGNGAVNYTAAANTGTSARTGTLTVGGQTFTVTQAAPPCSYSISPVSQSTPAAGGTGSVAVTAAAGCTWTASSNAAWLTISAGTSGSGNGAVSYTVAANTGTAARTGTLTVGGQTFTVTQAGAPCSYSISPISQSVPSGASTGSVAVSALGGCTWTATSNAAWLTITAGGSGSGGGTVSFSVAANTTGATRTGTLTVAGQTFTVTQAGGPCSYDATPLFQSAVAGGGTGTIAVTASTGCSWAATSNTAWLTITTGASGTGNGSVGYSVPANTGTNARNGTMTIAGKTVTISQPGAGCSYAIAPTSQASPASGGTGSVNITAATGCSWSALSNAQWLSVTAGGSGNGSGILNYSVQANTTTSARTGTVTIAGQTFTVTQAATSSCTMSISPVSASLPASGSGGTSAVTAAAGCTWSATSNAAWLTVTAGASGTGNGSVSFSATANTGTSARTGTLTIAGQTFTVTQAGTSCGYTLSATSQTVASVGGSGSITVTSTSGCTWTATSNATWLTITTGASGTGNGLVSFSAAANTTGAARTGTLTIAGQTFTVTQPAGSCSFNVIPLFQSAPAGGATNTLSVTASAGCDWSSTSPVAWLTITSGASGTGNGSVSYSVSTNASTQGRTATLTVAGKSVSVTQAGTTCSYSISPTNQSAPSEGGAGSVAVSASSSCTWIAVSNSSWISISAGTSGSGAGTVSYSVLTNTGSSPRTGTVTVAGQTFTVNQAATSTLAPSSSTPQTGLSTTQSSPASDTSLTVLDPGTGPAGPSTSQPAKCTYVVAPTATSLSKSGGTFSVSVVAQSGCKWTASSGSQWITIVAGASGNGSGSVTASASINGSTASRSGTLTIGGQAVTVTQGLTACGYTLSQSISRVDSGINTGVVTVTTDPSCTWAPTTTATWLTLQATATSFSFTTQANTTGLNRSATIRVGGTTFTLMQLTKKGPNAPAKPRVVVAGGQ